MIRRSVAGLMVVALEEGAPDDLMRWIRELPQADPHQPSDVTWRNRPADPSAGNSPAARLDDQGAWECWGAGHHLLALIQDVLVTRSTTLIHGCGVEFSGRGVVIVGRSGAGKSLASLAAVSDGRVRLLSDDLVVVATSGRVHAFPTAIAVKPYHFPLLPEEVADAHHLHARQSALLDRLKRLPLARSAGRTVRAKLAGRDGRIGTWSRLVKTDYLAIPTEELVPRAQRVEETTAALVVMIDDQGPAGVTSADVDAAVDIGYESTYENENMMQAVGHYVDAGHIDPAVHHVLARENIGRFMASADRLVRVRLPRSTNIVEAQEWLLDVIETNLEDVRGQESTTPE